MSETNGPGHDVVWMESRDGEFTGWLLERQAIEHDATKYLRATPEREAAPDLVEALEKIEKTFSDGLHRAANAEHQADLIFAISLARAALAKATGE